MLTDNAAICFTRLSLYGDEASRLELRFTYFLVALFLKCTGSYFLSTDRFPQTSGVLGYMLLLITTFANIGIHYQIKYQCPV